jgi:hypothetical protein
MSSFPKRKPPQREIGRRPLDSDDLSLMIRIAKEQAALVDDLERALKANQVDEIIRIGWLICGREASDASKPDRSDPTIHR